MEISIGFAHHLPYETRTKGLKKISFFALVFFATCFGTRLGATSQEDRSPESTPAKNQIKTELQEKIKKKSQISYRADLKGASIRSYGVIISCIDGKVSAIRSLYDPSLASDPRPIRQIVDLDLDQYLNLWDSLIRRGALDMKDRPPSTLPHSEESSVHFLLSLGKDTHEFSVTDLNRPEMATFLALQSLIDRTADMRSLWDSYQRTVKR